MMPEDWTRKYLAEVATYRSGRTPARANPAFWADADNGVPWVAISDMAEFGVVTSTKEKITQNAFDSVFGRRAVRAGTLLMSFKLTIGRVATLGIDACHNEAIISIYPKPEIDQRFLGYFLSRVDYDALQDRQIMGNTLNQEKIDRIEIWTPSFAEQRAIADILDLVRHSIRTQERSIYIAIELKRATMQALFTRGLRGESQKETEIGLLPGSWEAGRLDQYAEVISTRMTYSELEMAQPDCRPNSVKVLGIKVGDMNRPGNEVGLHHAELEKSLPKVVAERRCAPPRTIIFPKRGAAIATNKKRICHEWTVFDPNVIGVIAKEEIEQEYLFQWFQGFDLRTITEPGPTPQLNKKNLEPLIIPVPPTLAEQKDIASILGQIDRKIDLHRRKRAMLDHLFKALLRKLMTGEIRTGQLDLSAISSAAPAVVAV
jgi:type I restriction enzyme S subunit